MYYLVINSLDTETPCFTDMPTHARYTSTKDKTIEIILETDTCHVFHIFIAS